MTEHSNLAKADAADRSVVRTRQQRGRLGSGGNGRRRLLVLLCLVGLGWASAPGAVRGQEVIDRQYELKATYLVYFGYYVRWPQMAEGELADKFVIGILGQDNFGDHLKSAVQRTGRVGEKPIVIRHFPTVSDFEPCHILFLSRNASPGDDSTLVERLEAIREGTHSAPVLLVSEVEGLAARGVVINMVIDRQQNRLTLIINMDAAKRAALTISSRLLGLEQKGRVKIYREPAPE